MDGEFLEGLLIFSAVVALFIIIWAGQRQRRRGRSNSGDSGSSTTDHGSNDGGGDGGGGDGGGGD